MRTVNVGIIGLGPRAETLLASFLALEGVAVTAVADLLRPYSRNGRVQGTKGIYLEDTKGIYIEGMSKAVTLMDAAGNPYDEFYWDQIHEECFDV